MIERVDRAHRFRLTHRGRGSEREPTSEHRRASEKVLFSLAEKIETPVDRGAQRLVPFPGRARPPSQELEAIVQMVSDLEDR